MDHILDLRPYHGRVHITTQVVSILDCVAGDFLYDPKQGYHGKVVMADPNWRRVHWFKWDPAIEMPMREDIWGGKVVNKIIFDEEEMLPQEIAELRHKLDLSRHEKGGPYN